MTASLLVDFRGFALNVGPELITVHHGSRLVGVAFPAVVKNPAGDWYSRPSGVDAKRRSSRAGAVAFLLDVGVDELPCLDCGLKKWDAADLNPGEYVCTCNEETTR